ncbi:TPA: hypothetical protein ACG1JD_003184, partial [Citrobacter sedlakii]
RIKCEYIFSDALSQLNMSFVNPVAVRRQNVPEYPAAAQAMSCNAWGCLVFLVPGGINIPY